MRNRFKGLDLIDRVPGELWMEVHDIVQEMVNKIIPKKKKFKKAKWLSEEALQIAEKRRDHLSGFERAQLEFHHLYFGQVYFKGSFQNSHAAPCPKTIRGTSLVV